MNPLAAAIVSGSIIVAGNYARGKAPNITQAIGIGGIAIGLAALDAINAELASAFGVLIVVSMLVWHFPAIADALKKALNQ